MAGRDPVDPVTSLGVLDHLGRCGVVPVAVVDAVEDAPAVADALLAAGLPCIEVTFRTPAAPAVITLLTGRNPDLLVGAGTVMTVEQVDEARTAGARFVVSPVLDEAVVRRCLDLDLPVIPGVATATEVHRAMALGVPVVKLFPAEALGGVGTIRSLSSVVPDARFMPTGGIDEHVLPSYLAEPAVVACGGTWLLPRQMIVEGRFEEIEQRIARAVAVVRSVRPDA